MQYLLGRLFAPVTFCLGIDFADIPKVGELLGIKVTINEFVAYERLGQMITNKDISERAAKITTYALCGFANFASVAVQVGGIVAIAPSRKSDLARLGLKAMMGGAFASWMTACIASILLSCLSLGSYCCAGP